MTDEEFAAELAAQSGAPPAPAAPVDTPPVAPGAPMTDEDLAAKLAASTRPQLKSGFHDCSKRTHRAGQTPRRAKMGNRPASTQNIRAVGSLQVGTIAGTTTIVEKG